VTANEKRFAGGSLRQRADPWLQSGGARVDGDEKTGNAGRQHRPREDHPVRPRWCAALQQILQRQRTTEIVFYLLRTVR